MERHIEASAPLRISIRATTDALPDAIHRLLGRQGQLGDVDLTAGAARPLRLSTSVSMAITPRPDDPGACAVSWTPRDHKRLIPSFVGELRAVADADGTLLHLRGDYQVPLGAIGALADEVVGRRLARDTLRDLLDRLTEAVAEAAIASQSGWRPAPPYPSY